MILYFCNMFGVIKAKIHLGKLEQVKEMMILKEL